ncbi:IS4 family transposase [Micromonospora inyonensis]|uniref:Transposase DDE domain-containing protein n=1 Tax=Micromonospora inyonensis TaxID=47866 RepID=A0A1C6RLE4_9ACTN|nr:IS4 family transposase [Micromonospora inyonensis]SCL17980.1 Transposase DDE domain-containing protein [Micromonospora inyonensis]
MSETVAVTADQVSLGVLVSAVPRDAVDAAVARFGVGAKRSDGKLPPHVVAYLTMALCLFGEDDYEEVATKVTGALTRFGCWDAAWSVPTASGISQARQRLGAPVMEEIFESVVQPVGTTDTRGAWLRRWRVLAIDGFDVDLPDTPGNAAEFGYAGSGGNRSAYPKARVVALAECGTHAFLAGEVSGYGTGEQTLAMRLYPRLRRDELLTADRGFYSFDAWSAAAGTGAALLWRAPTGLRLPVVRVLADGTYVSVVINPKIRGARRDRVVAAARAGQDLAPELAYLVRVVEYDVPDRDGNGTGELIVLLTTVLDPAEAHADELAEAYHLRWEEETSNDQLKTHLRGPGRLLRSRLPELAYQEIWAWLIVHHALAALITRAAEAADLDPDRISFTRALRIARRTATGTAGIPPWRLD